LGQAGKQQVELLQLGIDPFLELVVTGLEFAQLDLGRLRLCGLGLALVHALGDRAFEAGQRQFDPFNCGKRSEVPFGIAMASPVSLARPCKFPCARMWGRIGEVKSGQTALSIAAMAQRAIPGPLFLTLAGRGTKEAAIYPINTYRRPSAQGLDVQKDINSSMTSDPTALANMANAIRALAMDAVQAAESGHPGMPMGMADVATVLWSRFLKFDPGAPSGPIATASCCRRGMARCCSIRCFISGLCPAHDG
jgi:hypothetical protein